ncbi:MAG: hypothetical protein B7X95_01360 [Methylophilaceae bacterium 17-44-8]|nr:MAG: hypothetical protein B7X95_01360 [Methylophilaceae bacterium 17-44-8]
MAWPTSNVDTTHMDAAGDDPSQARAEIKKMADNVNAIKDAKGQASGVAELDTGSKLPESQLPTVPATKGGTGQTTYTVGDILYASATGTLSKLAAGTNGYVLKSNGPGALPTWQIEGGGFPSGTRMSFQQTSAPTGWTKETNAAYNNVALRIVTGTVSSGGADDFTTVFGVSKTTAGHALLFDQTPYFIPGSTPGGSITSLFPDSRPVRTASTHSHGLTLDLKYRDFIIAHKD